METAEEKVKRLEEAMETIRDTCDGWASHIAGRALEGKSLVEMARELDAADGSPSWKDVQATDFSEGRTSFGHPAEWHEDDQRGSPLLFVFFAMLFIGIAVYHWIWMER